VYTYGLRRKFGLQFDMRFECQAGCVTCCQQKGFVYLTEDDIVRAALFLGMSAVDFERKFVYRTTNLRRLRTPRNAQCGFLRSDGCSIHPAKPTQCRIFPFWPELVEDRKEWEKTGEWCPGIGKGELVQIEAARGLAQEMREAYPRLYR
jgi:Fe-S-cluster containining protein